eukprot:scaffold20289_cov23-Tisochrysis_lutea.AAC.2
MRAIASACFCQQSPHQGLTDPIIENKYGTLPALLNVCERVFLASPSTRAPVDADAEDWGGMAHDVEV